MSTRLSELRRQMSEAEVDGVLMFPSPNWRYALSFAPIANERLCILIVTQDQAAVVLPVFDVEEMRESSEDVLIFGWSDLDGPEDALAEAWRAVNGASLTTLAVDDGMPYMFTRLLFAHTGTATIGALSTSLPRYRLIKDARRDSGNSQDGPANRANAGRHGRHAQVRHVGTRAGAARESGHARERRRKP